MIKEIKKAIKTLLEVEAEEPKNTAPQDAGQKSVILDPSSLSEEMLAEEPDPMNTIGLFCDVTEEKVAEVIHGLLYLDHLYANSNPEKRKPIDFYVSTYGGSADDMFSLYDIMRNVKENNEIHTIGMGKVMSAGVLILAAGTQGKRKIGANCRVMIHSVLGANHGSLHNMINEMEAIEQLQDMYISCLAANTKMTKSQIKKMLERKVNVYLTAEEAVELGIADIII